MKATFVTTGDVRTEYNADGSTKCYHVGRVDGLPICLHYCIEEYFVSGYRIVIDSYGSPWVRK